MPDPKLAQLSCLSLSLSAFEEQHPFSGQVWSCLLNQGLFLPWVHGTDVAVWIKSASFRIWLLWQIRGDDSTSSTKGTCQGRDPSPRSLGCHGVSVEMMPFPSAGIPRRGSEEGKASSGVPWQWCLSSQHCGAQLPHGHLRDGVSSPSKAPQPGLVMLQPWRTLSFQHMWVLQ